MVVADTLSKIYTGGESPVTALRGVSFSVAAGEFVALMGPSGCGKSTLLHLCGAMDRPTSGRLLFDGRDLAALDDEALTVVRRDRVGFVFQFFNLLPTLTLGDNIMLPALLSGCERTRSPGPRHGPRRACRHRAPAGTLSAAGVRRRNAARRHRPRPGPSAGPAHRRRTDRQPRFRQRRGRARAAARTEPRNGRHDAAGDPRAPTWPRRRTARCGCATGSWHDGHDALATV